MTAANTVNGHIERAQTELTPTQVTAGSLFTVALGFTLLFVQGPLIHSPLYSFRHVAGITCH